MEQKSERTIRVGLVGYGKHGQWAVAPALKAATCVTFKAVADLSSENLAQLPEPRVATYTDFRRMIQEEALDAVYVATRVESHAEVVLAALRAGLHVIVEKPMGVSVQECRQMVDAAKKANRLLAVDFESRYISGFRKIRDWIAAGRLGQLGAIHMDNFWDGHKATGPLAERRRLFCESSGCLDCGIHKLDLARYFNGGGNWLDIRAYGAWFGEKVRYAPHISIQARLDTGVLVNINASFAFSAYIPQRSSYNTLAILGEKGVVTLLQAPDGTHHLQIVSETLTEVVPLTQHGHTSDIELLLNDFAAAVLAGRPLPPEIATGEDGLMAQMIVDEANRQAVEAGDSCQLQRGISA